MALIFLPIPAFLFCSSFFFLLFFLLSRSQRKTRTLPVNWPIVGMLPAMLAEYHRLLDYMADILRASGGTFVLKLVWFCDSEFIVTCDPANANYISNSKFANYPKGDEFADIFDDVLGKGIITADGDSWRVQRRMGHAIMGDPRFRRSIASCSRDKTAGALLPLLDRAADDGVQVDLHDVFLRYTFDNACKLFLGTDSGCLTAGLPAVPLAVALDDAEELGVYRQMVPMAYWKLQRKLKVGEERKGVELKEVIDTFLDQCIKERREEKKRQDPSQPSSTTNLLTSYMEHPVEGGDDYFRSDKFLKDTVITFLAAGTDTTGSALSWFVWLVATNPGVEKKLLDELAKVRPRTSSDEMVVFDAEEVESLVYLNAVVCETLRLFPTVPINHKVASKDDVLPSGHRVRAGSKILVPIYAMGRMENIWGEDCMDFRPERWISDKGELKHEPSYKFLVFNSGPKTCLGKNMALTQMKLVAAAVLYNFHVRVVEGHVVEPKISLILRMKHGLKVTLKRRATGDAALN